MLIAACQTHGPPVPCLLSVDDFEDPSEAEITSEEIHISVIPQVGGCDGRVLLCFKLSTTTARILIHRLSEAVLGRDYAIEHPHYHLEEDWPPGHL
jgi:hypothetical protein